ncbi:MULTISPECIES: glycosyltransferase family 4 protein [Salinibaculum]|uniref:glycosyltransferase family 4 protein n=1 Tax=Salinibaculum TaxID=2732368 RepID=UPI0030CA6CBA
MRIAHYLYTSSEEVYGGEKSSLNFIEQLAERHSVTVILYGESNLIDHLEERDIDFEVISPEGPVPDAYRELKSTREGHSKWLTMARYNFRLWKYLRQEDFDLIHYNNIFGFLLTHPAVTMDRLPTVLHIRTKPQGTPWYWRVSLARADRCICVSDGVVKGLEEHLPAYLWNRVKGKTTRIHNPVRVDTAKQFLEDNDRSALRRQLGFTAEEFAIGYIGSIDERKNQFSFLKDIVVPAVKRCPDVRFYFLGGTKQNEYERKCKDFVVEKGISDAVTFAGYQSNIFEWYTSLDAIALYSHREGLPRAVLEGMAFGLPVVTNRTTGVDEIITDRKDGFIVEKPATFVNRLEELVNNDQLQKKMEKEAKETIGRSFSVTELSSRLEQVYADTIL